MINVKGRILNFKFSTVFTRFRNAEIQKFYPQHRKSKNQTKKIIL